MKKRKKDKACSVYFSRFHYNSKLTFQKWHLRKVLMLSLLTSAGYYPEERRAFIKKNKSGNNIFHSLINLAPLGLFLRLRSPWEGRYNPLLAHEPSVKYFGLRQAWFERDYHEESEFW